MTNNLIRAFVACLSRIMTKYLPQKRAKWESNFNFVENKLWNFLI